MYNSTRQQYLCSENPRTSRERRRNKTKKKCYSRALVRFREREYIQSLFEYKMKTGKEKKSLKQIIKHSAVRSMVYLCSPLCRTYLSLSSLSFCSVLYVRRTNTVQPCILNLFFAISLLRRHIIIMNSHGSSHRIKTDTRRNLSEHDFIVFFSSFFAFRSRQRQGFIKNTAKTKMMKMARKRNCGVGNKTTRWLHSVAANWSQREIFNLHQLLYMYVLTQSNPIEIMGHEMYPRRQKLHSFRYSSTFSCFAPKKKLFLSEIEGSVKKTIT